MDDPFRAATIAVKKADNEGLKRILTKHPTIIDKRCPFTGNTLLHLSVEVGISHITETLVHLGSKAIDTPNYQDITPLFCAISRKSPHQIEQLFRLGSRAVDRLCHEDTPLWEAVRTKEPRSVQLILNNGCTTVDTPCGEPHQPPFHMAVHIASKEIVEMLLKAGSKAIDVPDNHGQTPMHIAAYRQTSEMIEVLMMNGCTSIDIPNNEGYTPLGIAVCLKANQNVEALCRFGNKSITQLSPDSGFTPLHIAAGKNQSTIVEILASFGPIDTNVHCENGLTPLMLAQSHFAKDTAKTLMAIDGTVCTSELDLIQLTEEEIEQIRFRIYFSRSLVLRLLREIDLYYFQKIQLIKR
jgi:ankyrin repeat protein